MSESYARPVTRALVLAAGQGTRLGHTSAKPLFPIFGVPLLARTLHELRDAGVTEAYVVIGYNGEVVRRELPPVEGITVHWVENPRWREPNGVSVLAAEQYLDGSFVLTMSDHVFEAEIARRAIAALAPDDALVLAVDRDIDAVNDPDDATKVRVEGDRIVAIGKELEAYDAIDTGVFVATPALFRALRSIDDEGRGPSLSEGVARLAAERKAAVADVTGCVWQDVDTPDDVRAAERKLLSRWPKPTDGPVSRFINRPISTRITRLLAPLGVTPNQVSFITLLMGLASGWLAAVGGYRAWFWSALIFQVASILDGTDGELAVLTYRRTRFGAWVDTVADSLTYVAFLGGLTYGVVRAGMPPVYFWGGVVGFAATVLSLANIYMVVLREGGSGSALAVRYHYQEGESRFARLWHFLHYFGKRDLLAFLAFLFAAAGFLPVALPLFGAGATLFLLPATTLANLRSVRRSLHRPAAEEAPDLGPGEDVGPAAEPGGYVHS